MKAEHLGDSVATRRGLFVDLESPSDVAYQRLHGFGLRGAVAGFTYLHRPAGFDLLDDEGRARLRATIIEHAAELVVIDSLRRAAPSLDENDSRQVSVVLSELRALSAELHVTIVLIHHPRKPVGEARVEALYAARGSGDLIGSADSAIFFRKLKGGLVRVEHAKARRGREHEHLHFRIVGNEETGAPELEHVLVDADRASEGDEAIRRRVLEWLEANSGWHSTSAVRAEVKGDDKAIDRALRGLFQEGEIGLSVAGQSVDPETVGDEQFTDWHRQKRAKHWQATSHAGLQSVIPLTPTGTDIGPAPPEEAGVGEVGEPPKGPPTKHRPTVEGRNRKSKPTDPDDGGAGT